MVLFQTITKNLKIIRMKHPGIFLYLTVIGIDLKLTVFMPHYRAGTVRNGTGIVFIRSRTRIIQNATLLSIYVRKGSTYMSRISVSTTYTAGHKEIFSILRTFPTKVIIGTEAIQMTIILITEIIEPFTHYIYLRIQFITQTQHHK